MPMMMHRPVSAISVLLCLAWHALRFHARRYSIVRLWTLRRATRHYLSTSHARGKVSLIVDTGACQRFMHLIKKARRRLWLPRKCAWLELL